MDFFAPEAFGAVLDYMYGKSLAFSIEVPPCLPLAPDLFFTWPHARTVFLHCIHQGAEPILKVIRRLEMSQLQEHCWHYMMTVIDQSNCLILHEFADR